MSTVSIVFAHSEHGEWSEPVLLFEGDGSIYNPVIVGDREGGLHVFWRYTDDHNLTQAAHYIYYTYYNGINWSIPVDIIAASNVNTPNVITDNSGHVHMTWHGVNDQLLYSKAMIDTRVSALSWIKPITLDITNIYAHMVSDNNGRLYAFYPGQGNSGIYYRASDDGGLNWSNPVNIAITSQLQTSANHVRVAVDDSNKLHVVWSEFLSPDGWPPVGVFYTRSEDGGQTWSEITQLAGEGYNQINVAAGPDNEVHVAWNGMAGVYGRYYRYSSDGGLTWSETIRLNTAGRAGSTGNPPMLVDSDGTLHLLVNETGYLLYLHRQDNFWSEADCLSCRAVGSINWTEQPDMTIVNGNHLHVVFWDNRERLWYMTRQIDAPALMPVPLPTTKQTSLSTESSAPTTVHTPDLSYLPGDSIGTDLEKADTFNPVQSVFMAILPALLIVVGAISIYIAFMKYQQ